MYALFPIFFSFCVILIKSQQHAVCNDSKKIGTNTAVVKQIIKIVEEPIALKDTVGTVRHKCINHACLQGLIRLRKVCGFKSIDREDSCGARLESHSDENTYCNKVVGTSSGSGDGGHGGRR